MQHNSRCSVSQQKDGRCALSAPGSHLTMEHWHHHRLFGRMAANSEEVPMIRFSSLLNLALGVALFGSLSALVAQTPDTQAVQSHMLVTVEARHGSDIPAVGRDDVMVYEGRDRDQIINWVP